MTLAEFAATSQAWAFGLTCLVGLVQVLVLWALWSLRKAFVTPQKCEECRQACRKEVGERLARQEANAGELHDKVAQTPTKDALAIVDKENEGVRGDIKALAATVQGQQELMKRFERQLNLLMEHHLGRRP